MAQPGWVATAGLFTLFAFVALWLEHQNAAIHRFLVEPDSFFIILSLFFVLFVLGGAMRRSGISEALLLVVVGMCAYPAARLAEFWPGSLLPVNTAVGYSGYMGYPKTKDYFAAILLLLLAVAAGSVAARFLPRFKEWKPEPLVHAVAGKRDRRFWGAAAVILFIAVLYQVNLAGQIFSFRDVLDPNVGWDHANATIWHYAVHSGLLPYRDFWFPYSGEFLFYERLPWGPIFFWIHYVICLGCLFGAIYVAANKRLLWAITVFGIILVPLQSQLLQGWPRYLMGIDFVLVTALANDLGIFSWAQMGRAAFAAYVFFLEPAQIVYAVAGITILAACQSFNEMAGLGDRKLRTHWFSDAARRVSLHLFRMLLPAVLGASIVLCYLAIAGMLPGFLAFHRSLGSQSLYAAFPATISAWTKPILQGDNIFLVFLILVALAVFRWIASKPLAASLLAICAAGSLCLQKQVMRPHIMHQFAIYPAVGVLLYVIAKWRTRTWAQNTVACLFGATIVALSFANGTTDVLAASIWQTPQTTRSNFDLLRRGQAQIEQANAASFAPQRFARFTQERALISTLRTEFGLHLGDNVYVLGDDSLLYAMLGQKPPYQVNLYNMSPLSEQNTVVSWLEQMRPRFAIWDTTDTAFDGVPHVIRVPQVFRYVQAHYEPVKTVGRFDILRRTSTPGDIHVDYWRQRLGPSLDLGYIPLRARLKDYPACRGGDCQNLLLIHFEMSPDYIRKAFARFQVQDNWYTVYFDVTPGDLDYLINLDRLWFWPGKQGVLSIESEPDTKRSLYSRGGRFTVLY